MNSPLTPRRKKLPSVARLASPRSPRFVRPSTYVSPRATLSPSLRCPSEGTPQQFVENIKRELMTRMGVCKSDFDRFLVHRDIFESVAQRFGSTGGVRTLKDGYDAIIDQLMSECSQNDQKQESLRASTSQIDAEIQNQQNKLMRKREKYEQLSKQLDFSIGDLTKETDEQTDELVGLQKKARKLQTAVKEQAITINELTHKEEIVLAEYEKWMNEKLTLEAELAKATEERQTIKSELAEFMQVIYETSDQLRETEIRAEQTRNNLKAEMEEIERIRNELLPLQQQFTEQQALLNEKNEIFEKNSDLIIKLGNALKKH